MPGGIPGSMEGPHVGSLQVLSLSTPGTFGDSLGDSTSCYSVIWSLSSASLRAVTEGASRDREGTLRSWSLCAHRCRGRPSFTAHAGGLLPLWLENPRPVSDPPK